MYPREASVIMMGLCEVMRTQGTGCINCAWREMTNVHQCILNVINYHGTEPADYILTNAWCLS